MKALIIVLATVFSVSAFGAAKTEGKSARKPAQSGETNLICGEAVSVNVIMDGAEGQDISAVIKEFRSNKKYAVVRVCAQIAADLNNEPLVVVLGIAKNKEVLSAMRYSSLDVR